MRIYENKIRVERSELIGVAEPKSKSIVTSG